MPDFFQKQIVPPFDWAQIPVAPVADSLPGNQTERALMRRCLELARTACGQTAPNPLVGSLIVREDIREDIQENIQGDRILGEGYHPRAGEPHAEVFALRQAQARAPEQIQHATLYVNLEPCSHYGRTPPCAEAIAASGIKRVVVGMVDPNPQVAGRGIERLRQAGIDVLVGVEQAACQTLNEAFIHRMVHQRPFGLLKYAMTLDGKIAASSGHSFWVTGPEARARVHDLRRRCEAVIIGGNTLRRDDPLLTSRQGVTPLRVVMSRGLDLPLTARLWDVQAAPTLVFTEASQADPRVLQALGNSGVEVIALPHLRPQAVMQQLYHRGVLTVLWECGGTLAAAALAEGAVQKVWAFVAPKLIGGPTAPSPLGDLGLTRMDQAMGLEKIHIEKIGADLLIEGYTIAATPQTFPEASD
jgi:diaminohydroxyphosphoribosylaminopyrimidine deaminase / 5-amino-6-(5-phosphoribosylamino)uracil reductase